MQTVILPHIPTRVCLFCKGSGRCEKCAGAGHRVVRSAGWLASRRVEPCQACEATRECQLCGGRGRLD